MLEKRKDDNLKSYDVLWILWTSFWANRLAVKKLYFALD